MIRIKEWVEKRKQKKWHKVTYKMNCDYKIWYDCVHLNIHPIIKRGCGYYLNVSAFNIMATEYINNPGLWNKTSIDEISQQTKKSIYDTIWEPLMESGRVMVAKLHSYEMFRDPYDMIKESSWICIGYKGFKPIKECTWEEYQQCYVIKEVKAQ